MSALVRGSAAAGRDFARTRSAVEDGIVGRLHYGAQIYASVDGVPVCDLAIGFASPDGAPLAADAILPWFSSVKPALAVLLGVAVDKGLVAGFDSRVADHVPEFRARGKGAITFSDVLTHTAGLALAGADEAMRGDAWGAILRATCGSAPAGEAGGECAYSMGGAFHVVAEALMRAFPGNLSYGALLAREVFGPLGLGSDCWCGLVGDAYDGAAPRIAAMHDMGGTGADDGTSSRDACSRDDPTGGGRGPARALGALYARIVADGADGAVAGRLLAPATARTLATAVYPGTHDVVQGLDLDVGLALYGRPKFAGRYASPRTFGHGGSRSSFGFGDPRRKLAVAVVFNGRPASADAHYDRAIAVSEALYRDLGYADFMKMLRAGPKRRPGEPPES